MGFCSACFVQALNGLVGQKIDEVLLLVGVLLKSADHVFEFFDTYAVNLVNQSAGAHAEVGIYGVREDRGQNNRFGAGGFGRFVLAIEEFVHERRVRRIAPAAAESTEIIASERNENEAAI